MVKYGREDYGEKLNVQRYWESLGLYLYNVM